MKQTEQIKQYAELLRLTQTRNNPEGLIHQAQLEKTSYSDFLHTVLKQEVLHRQKTDLERRTKLARLPKDHNLDKYDFNFANGLSAPELKQLRELIWLDQNYNLILMGPSGTGKTYLASGLIKDAVENGYKAYFTTMRS